MSPRAPKGPRPQRVEVEDAIDALVEETTGALGALTGLPLEQLREGVRAHTLRLLELVGVDSAGVTVTSEATPKAKRVRRPGHDEDV